MPFFLGRAVFYFTAWITTAYFLNRWSLEQDAGADPRLTRRLEMLSRGGLLLYALTMTFAAMDWGMSLEPHWFSTIYGVMFMGGQGLSTFAFMIPMAALLAERQPFTRIIGPEQFHDLGKLMLAFVMLWAYFALSQYLIIWSANLPEEIPFYLARTRGGWQWVALVLVLVHFVMPFLVLLSRDIKRHARAVAVVALVLVAARFVDLFWLLRPAVAPEGVALHWLDPAAAAAIGGMWIWLFVVAAEDPARAAAQRPGHPEGGLSMDTRSHPEPPAPDVTLGHEERDVYPRPIVLAVLGLVAVSAAAFVAMHLLFNLLAAFEARETAAPSPLAGTYGLKEAPAPRLQTSPLHDLVDLRARDAAALHEYAWVDRDAGVVRIPIERAIALLAERGLPARPAAPKEKP